MKYLRNYSTYGSRERAETKRCERRVSCNLSIIVTLPLYLRIGS